MNASFYRKVVYGALIALLWFPLFFIGQPPSRDAQGKRTGGQLSQMRDQYDLSQAELGEVDPTSESMKLATLGLRPVAINILWTMANHYKKVEDFDNFAATVNQITLLAPNFVSVWEFQAHNESYNVSVEYDHYRLRYAWVKRGIDLLIKGIQYNRKDTRLLNYLSWFFGHKIGRADEHKQFRELYRNDKDFHDDLNRYMAMDDREIMGPDKVRPDNWLTGRQWQLRAVNLVESAAVDIRGKSPVLFYSDAPMLRINYCKAIEEEGILGQVAGEAWRVALVDWDDYGTRPIKTSWGHDILLGQKEVDKFQRQLKAISDELDNKLAPGIREKILQEKLAKLTPEQRAAHETPADKRTETQMRLVYETEYQIAVTPDEVADRVAPENRRRAKLLAREHEEAYSMLGKMERYRNIVNYGYWRTRCEVEQSDEALAARQAIRDAEIKFKAAEFTESATGEPGAKELYEKAWKSWAKIYEKHPELMEDVTADELLESIELYKRLLSQLEYRDLPADFPLFPLLEKHNKATTLGKGAQPASGVKPETKTPETKAPSSNEPDEKKKDDAPSDPEKKDGEAKKEDNQKADDKVDSAPPQTDAKQDDAAAPKGTPENKRPDDAKKES